MSKPDFLIFSTQSGLFPRQDQLNAIRSPETSDHVNPSEVDTVVVDPALSPTFRDRNEVPLNLDDDSALVLDQVYFTPIFRIGTLNSNQVLSSDIFL